jgi:hypothetical protein
VGDRFDIISFRDPGVPDRFGLTEEACEKFVHLVLPGGKTFRGAEAIARALMLKPLLALFSWIYYVPGIRWLSEYSYRHISDYRFWISENLRKSTSGRK